MQDLFTLQSVATIITTSLCKSYALPTPTNLCCVVCIKILLSCTIDSQVLARKGSNVLSLRNQWIISTSVRLSTPFSADTDTPIFCCQSNTISKRCRFFDTLQERTWRRVTDRSKDPDATAATNNSGAPRTCCSAVADAFDLSWTVKHSNYQ